ncbi:MAG: phosphatidylserine decarboxylase [Azospirillaceae bacterium]
MMRVHREIRPFAAAAVLAAIPAAWLWPPAIVAPALALVALVFFFRDPRRAVPRDPTAVVAPADGRVLRVDRVVPDFLGDFPARDADSAGGPAFDRLAIFLSLLDVHVVRAPCAGTVTGKAYRRGRFLHAGSPEAETRNERNVIAIEDETGGRVFVVQSAGLVARKILCFVGPGDRVAAGDELGFIRFGSRVDVFVEAPVAFGKAVGDRVHGGAETIGRRRS